jgi:hypothetical protein
MAALYIANTTKQHVHFYYRLPEEPTPRFDEIRVGAQARIGGDLSHEVIQRIIKQHEPYGLRAEAELPRAKGFVGLCYSIDKPVKLDSLYGTFESNDTALNERAEERREESAAAIAEGIQSTLQASGGAVSRSEVEVVEDTRGTPAVASGYEVVSEGTEPRHGGKQSRKTLSRGSR